MAAYDGTYTWDFGSQTEALWFSVSYDTVSNLWTVTMKKGSMDLNALWWSNDNTSQDGDIIVLSKADSSLNMNGTKVTWDGYDKISDTSLVGKEHYNGSSYSSLLAVGNTYTYSYSLDGGLDIESLLEAGTTTLGVRATSVNGETSGGGIKAVESSYSFTPIVTLAIGSPDSVVEGSGRLVYTFTRTGLSSSLANSLTVYYNVGGTATDDDYAAAAIPGSVTFAANSTTAIVTVDPNFDNDIEPDETVELTLASGISYTIGTPGAVTGTIVDSPHPPPAGWGADFTGDFFFLEDRHGWSDTDGITGTQFTGGLSFDANGYGDWFWQPSPSGVGIDGIVEPGSRLYGRIAMPDAVTLNGGYIQIDSSFDRLNWTLNGPDLDPHYIFINPYQPVEVPAGVTSLDVVVQNNGNGGLDEVDIIHIDRIQISTSPFI